MWRLRAQQIDDLGQSVRRRAGLWHNGSVMRGGQSATEFGEGGGHPGHLQHEIDRAGLDRAARHAVISRLVGVLRDHQAVLLLDRPQPEHTVGPGTGQDHADRALAVIRRQGVQQKIERHPGAMPGLGRREMQHTVGDGQILARRDDI